MAPDPKCLHKENVLAFHLKGWQISHFLKALKSFLAKLFIFSQLLALALYFCPVLLLVNANGGGGGGGCIKMQMIYAEMHSQHFIIQPEK